MPEVPRVGYQIVNLKSVPLRNAPFFDRQFQPTGMRVARVEIDHGDNEVLEIRCAFAVGDELLVVDIIKLKAPIALQGGVVAPDSVYLRDQIAQTL